MRDFAIRLTHRPGELARVTNALSLVGVNIKSMAAMTFDDQALLRLIPDDVEATRNVLKNDNIRFEESELLNVLVENRAGELTEVASRLEQAGLDIQAIYVVGLVDDLIELAISVDNIKKAKKLFE